MENELSEAARPRFIADNEQLTFPASIAALQERASQLAEEPLASFADKAEMAAILRLMRNGAVTAGEVWELLLAYYRYRPVGGSADTADWLVPVHVDQVAVWSNLAQLVNGQPVEQPKRPAEPADLDGYDTEHEAAYERWLAAQNAAAQRWAQDAMHTLEYVLAADSLFRLYEWNVADILPGDLVRHVHHEAAREWLGSPYVIGATLQSLPSNAAGGFGINGQGVWVIDALARVVLASVDELKAAAVADGNSEATAIAHGRLVMWWMLLKGFVFSMLSTELGASLPRMMLRFPEIIERVAEALEQGLVAAGEHEYLVTIPEWGGGATELGERIATASTADLLQRLHDRLATEAETLARLRSRR